METRLICQDVGINKVPFRGSFWPKIAITIKSNWLARTEPERAAVQV